MELSASQTHYSGKLISSPCSKEPVALGAEYGVVALVVTISAIYEHALIIVRVLVLVLIICLPGHLRSTGNVNVM